MSLYLDCGRRPSFVHYTFSASLLCRVMDVDFFGLFLWPPFCLVCRCARYATRACDVRDLPQALFECVMSTLPGLLGFTGFYWVLLFFFVSTKVPLGSPVFYWVCLVLFIQSQLSFIGCYRAELALPGLLGFTGFYWVLLFFFVSTKVPLGSPVFYWVCLVLFIQSQLSFIGCYRAELSLPGCTGFVRV